MKHQILMLIIILFTTIGCENQDSNITPNNVIIGEWIYEYELMSDGTKNFDNPYALLEFTYSDGFILNEDGTGHSVWNEVINENFEWVFNNSKLTISVTRSDNSIDKFEYQISNMNESSMQFESPKGYKFMLRKK